MLRQGFIRFIRQSLTAFRHQLLPGQCFLCHDRCTQPLCLACLADLPYQKKSCIYCATAVQTEKICQECQKQRPPYAAAQTVFPYQYPIDQLILAAKFYQNLAILNLLGHLMAQHLMLEPYPDVLIPVPLHPKRLRQRGYNQSLELAKPISQRTGIPLAYQACQRVKNTRPQTQLSGAQRQINLKEAFQVTRIQPHWQHIVLIDDVMTTGTTMRELTQVFKMVGIPRIEVWCCARRFDALPLN